MVGDAKERQRLCDRLDQHIEEIEEKWEGEDMTRDEYNLMLAEKKGLERLRKQLCSSEDADASSQQKGGGEMSEGLTRKDRKAIILGLIYRAFHVDGVEVHDEDVAETILKVTEVNLS